MSELLMTVVCKSCDNQYGAWRAQCPACGTKSHYRAPEPEKKPRQKRTEAMKPRREHECILCRRDKSDQRCPSCNEEIHTRCLKYHRADCEKFVAEREAILASLPTAGEEAIKRAEAMGRMDIADRVRAAMRQAGMQVHS
jgi:predicted amidophosphoribosyltransferase